jgi:voltage-gated potassium channel Kch
VETRVVYRAVARPRQDEPVSTQNASVAERTRYWFDGVMARGTAALIGLLALVTLVFLIVVAGIVEVLRLFPPDAKPGFADVLWGNLMRTLDSGTMGGDVGWGFRAAMLVVTIGGVVVVASLIGIISTGFDAKVADLRKGRSRVIERDHTLILGWNTKVFAIIAELSIANESRRRPVVVVLADRDKVEMEDELRARLPGRRKTRVVCRSGDPMNLADLRIGNPQGARSVVILASDGATDPDSAVIKTALALTNSPDRRTEPYHIVGEIQDPDNLEAARLVGRHEAEWVLASEVISRITVQSCRQSGLSAVYTELLDFEGDELYFTEAPTLHGSTYFETQLAFPKAAVVGMVRNGDVLVNPSGDTRFAPGDQLIVIAEDDSAIELGTPGRPDLSVVVEAPLPVPRAERTLVLGYNSGLAVMLRELAEYVAPGSEVTVVVDEGVMVKELPASEGLLVTVHRADTTSRRVLDALGVGTYDHVIVLAYKDDLDAPRADAKTLVTLLHLRDMADRAQTDYAIVSEMIDDGNRELAEITKADDFIVSDKLVSLMLAQISENKQLTDVFGVLFSSVGSEIYLRPAASYIRPGASADFYTVLEAASRRGETAIGYRRAALAGRSDERYGVRVNPTKGEVLRFEEHDRIIVLAES